jgi:leader peptidase (prepilin peptidase)/N-methyltransferase
MLMGGAIGGGDIKLMFVLGLWLGGEALLAIAMGGFLLSGLVALVMLGTGRWKRDERFAYSPYFSLMALSFLLMAP